MIRIAVCDDDREFSARLKLLINKYYFEEKVEFYAAVFNSGMDLLFGKKDYNAVFLDIDMPNIGGFEIAEKLSSDILIVFVTAHDELVYSSLKFRPFRFIRKGHLENELPEVLADLKKVIFKNNAKKKFILQTKSGEAVLNIDDIEYIEIYGHQIRIIVAGADPLECYGSLSVLEKQLSDFNFVRTHKSYLVNCKYIFSIEKNRIILDSKTEIPLSRQRVDIVKSKFKNHIWSMI